MTISGSATSIGKSVKIRGEIVSGEDLMLDGDFEGTMHITGATLTLGPGARVRGSIHAQDVVVQGRLDGEIHAVGQVELRTGAMVQGDISSAGLSIEPNVAFRGKVEPIAQQQVAVRDTPERAAVPMRPAAVPHAAGSFGLAGGSGVRTSVVPASAVGYGGSPFSGNAHSSGTHRIAGAYPTGLAAAAAAAAGRVAPQANDEGEPTPSPSLVFNERKA